MKEKHKYWKYRYCKVEDKKNKKNKKNKKYK